MAEISLETVAKILLGLIVVGLLIWILFTNVITLKSPFLSLFSPSQEEQIVDVSTDLPFYNEFVKNYNECKLSPSTECFCPVTYPEIPDNYAIEITNFPNSKSTIIKLYGNVQLKDCNTLLQTGNINTVESKIENDLLFFENVYTSPDVIGLEYEEQEIQTEEGFRQASVLKNFGKLQTSDFSQVERLYLFEDELCSTKDVKGDNDINFERGAIYKFDNEKTTFISEIFRLKKCDTVKDIVPAYEEFNKLISKINSCSSTKRIEDCKYVIKEDETSAIPQDFTLSLENNKIVLKYKEKEIKSSDEIKKELCLFTDFRNTNENQASQLNSLVFNNYLEVDIYPFEDKVCFLPYDFNLLQQKKVAELSENINNEPIVPI